MKLLRYILNHNKITLSLAVLVSFVAGISSAALVALISQQLTNQQPLTFVFIGYFMGLVLLFLLLELVAKWLLIRLTAWNSYHLRMHLSRQILKKPLHDLENMGSPKLLALLTEDVQNIGQGLNQIPSFCISIAIIIACSFYLAWLSPLALLVLLLLAVPAMFGHRILLKKGKQVFSQVLKLRDQQFGHFQALSEGTKELKLHQPRRQSFLHELLEPTTAAHQDKLIAGRIWHEIASTWSQSLYFIFILGLFALAAIKQTSPEILTAYALVALYMKSYVARFLSALPHWSRAEVTLQKIESLGFSLEASDEIFEQHKTTTNKDLCLELKGIAHTYTREFDDSQFTLGPINLKFTSGELVFLTGGNGSGKTTLIKVLTALYTPEVGGIYLNGNLITNETLESYRQNFSVIFADFFLFEQLLGLEGNNFKANISEYLTMLQLEHKVSIQDGKLSTTNLSTGQRKRLALLTAYLEDRPIYIFDEWAASQDPLFKEIFYRKLLPELKSRGKLIIVISHDDHYYDIADHIVKLDYGQLSID